MSGFPRGKPCASSRCAGNAGGGQLVRTSATSASIICWPVAIANETRWWPDARSRTDRPRPSVRGALIVTAQVSPADMNPHQSQAFILDVSRGAGIGRVHDRYIISPRQVHDRLYQIQSPERGHREPLRHHDAARAESRPAHTQYRSPRRRASLLHGGGRRALGHHLGEASMGWRGLIRKAALAAGTNKTSPPPSASRTAQNRPTGCVAYTSQASSPDARVTGQNGHGSAKQAVPRTAPSARTLSAICP